MLVTNQNPKLPNNPGPRHSVSVQSLVPVGWAPGPVGEGCPFDDSPLEVSLPKEYMVPGAHKHYENLQDQLRHRAHAGGQDTLTVLINARLTTQEPGWVMPHILLVSSVILLRSCADYPFKCETIADVPVRIDHGNLQQNLINAFLSHWLKKFASFPLGTEHVVSVRLMKGKSGIHLDNKEHAILEHCLSPNRKKLAGTELSILLVLDIDHVEAVQAHTHQANTQGKADLDLEYSVRFYYRLNISILLSSILTIQQHSHDHSLTLKPTLLVNCTEQTSDRDLGATQSEIGTWSRPRPHPIFVHKRKLSSSLVRLARHLRSDAKSLQDPPNNEDKQVSIPQDRKCTWADQTSHMTATVDNIIQALIAQHEPPQTAVDGLHVYLSLLMWPHLTHYLS